MKITGRFCLWPQKIPVIDRELLLFNEETKSVSHPNEVRSMKSDPQSIFDPLAEVVDRCLDGGETAREELYDNCREDVYRLMVRMVGRQEAVDLTQHVFLTVFSKLDQFHGKSQFKTWLYRLSVNEALQFLRKTNRRVEPLMREPVDNQACENSRLESHELLEMGLNCLEPLLRSIFLLKESEGLSYREIADVTGIPEGTVGSRLNRARRQLREHLIELGWEE